MTIALGMVCCITEDELNSIIKKGRMMVKEGKDRKLQAEDAPPLEWSGWEHFWGDDDP